MMSLIQVSKKSKKSELLSEKEMYGYHQIWKELGF